eukprot:6648457-Ditylum_brightwellii.AAC.1
MHQLLENYLLEINHGDQTLNIKEFIEMVESWQGGPNQHVESEMEIKSFWMPLKETGNAKPSTVDKRSIL